jgi:hypothetical protein
MYTVLHFLLHDVCHLLNNLLSSILQLNLCPAVGIACSMQAKCPQEMQTFYSNTAINLILSFLFTTKKEVLMLLLW